MTDETCKYCGRRGDDVCDSPPPDTCELAMTPNPRAVGFTGTRNGMTQIQTVAVATLIRDFQTLHHGDCNGADEQTHAIAVQSDLRTESHPPIKTVMRAFCQADVIHEPKDYIARNHDIVDATCHLIAAPRTMYEDNSGTWATIRYARKMFKPVTVVFPDGKVWHG